MPNATKRALAASLKRLLETTPLDKITIQNLVDDAEVSRKTFYYHFQDIYDLLEWGLADQVNHAFEGWATADGWEQGLERIFASLEENRTAILNIYRSKNRELLDHHLAGMAGRLLLNIFNAQPGYERVTEEDRDFILELYSYGVVSFFLYWLSKGMKPEARVVMPRIHRLFQGSMESMIQRCLEE